MASTVIDMLPLDTFVQLGDFWESIARDHIVVVLVLHCLFCASLAPELKHSYMVHYLLTHCWAFGGGILTTMLIMDPSVAPHAFLTQNGVGIVWTLAWWAINYGWTGVIGRLHEQWYIKMFTKAGTSLLRAKLIISRVDLATQLYPGVVAAPLVLGTLAGCGGRLLADALKWGWAPVSPELGNPAWVSRSALLASAVYYLAAYHWSLVSPEALTGLIITLKMVHSFASDLAGTPLDITEPLANLVLRITNIPSPSDAPVATTKKPAPRRATASSADATAVTTSTAVAPTATEPTRRSSRIRAKAA